MTEPADGVLGSIACTVLDQAQVVVDYTDLIATIGGTRYPLTAAAQCYLVDVGGTPTLGVYATQIQFDGKEATVSLQVRANQIVPGQAYSLLDNNMTRPLETVDSGALWRGADPESAEVLGVFGGGYVVADSIPQVGGALGLFLEAPLHLPGASAPECGDGGAGHATCDDCLSAEQSAGGCCWPHLQACNESTACVGLSKCVGAGGDAQACVNQYPDGFDAYLSLLTCVFGSNSEGTVGACGVICE